MIMLKQDGFAKVDNIKTFPEHGFARVKLTATGIGKSGKEYTDFKGFATLFNNAYDKSVDLAEGDSIHILDMGVTTGSKGGNYYTNVNINDIEIIKNEEEQTDDEVVEVDDEELPFS